MQVRHTETEDIDVVLDLYAHARQRMRDAGNPNQWTTEYPTRENILKDIENGNSYVLTDDDGIAGTFAFIIGEEPTYAYIEDGEWPDDLPYGSIHRLAGYRNRKGVFEAVLDFCSKRIERIRIDTHADNRPMLHLMEKCGFRRCGIVYMQNGTPRIAFSKTYIR